MKVNLLRITTRTLIVGLLVNSTGAAAFDSAQDLVALTVPEERLPPGCRLEEEPKPNQRGIVVIARPNPWIGRDRHVLADIRRVVDGSPPELDGPPLMPREAAAFALRWADEVGEAYRATYRHTDESLIDVAAIRFNDERLATPAPPVGTKRTARGMISRIVVGPTVVLIAAGARSDCFEAIEDYVRSLR